MEYIKFGFIAMFALLASIIVSIKFRKNIGYFWRSLGVGTIVAIAVMFYPLSGDDLIYSVLTSLQASMLGAGYDEIIPKVINNFGDEIPNIYKTTLKFLMLLAPVFFGAVVVTSFDDLRYKIAYFIQKRYKEVCYFSELNENSMDLAISVVKEKRKRLIVFCNYNKNKTTSELVKIAKDNKFILFKDNEFHGALKGKGYRKIFEISNNYDINLDRTKKFIDDFEPEKIQPEKIEIYLFTEQVEAEIVMNSVNKKGLNIIIVDKPVRLAYDLMFHSPLYEALDKNKKLSALVIGADNLGTEMIKAISWCGQMGNDYSLKINVIDKDIERIKEKFDFDYPNLKDYACDINFYSADVRSQKFEQVLYDFCADTNYIVITLGDREEATKTAIYLREHYLRNSEDYMNYPIINVFVPNKIKFEYLLDLTVREKEYAIRPFGNKQNFYSFFNIVNSEIEKLAINAQAVYENIEKDDGSDNYKKIIIKNYNENEIGKRSNRANIIHMKYKLYTLGYQMKLCKEPTDVINKNTVEELKEKLEKERVNLAMLEHIRWNAFQISEGYRPVSIDNMKKYFQHTKSHKHDMAKLHPCICDWDGLDVLSNEYNKYINQLKKENVEFKNLGDKHFKDYDFDFIDKMLEILGLEENKFINISGVKYIIEKIKVE